jgi:methoxymalonate biosynthesis acyl carrier protein
LETEVKVKHDNESTIKSTIRDFILASVKIKDLSDDDNLFESGIVNSLFAVQLMTYLEKTFGIEVTMDDLSIENFESINSTSSFVLNKQNNK